jgi:glycosyltransferase involved in cell wall biosynthesis
MTQPDVSVIIPVHNGARFVAQAVESALDQQGVSTEVIVIDDASTDETLALLAAFADRVRLVTLPKQPTGIAATNAGLALATGEFVCVLHHDDFLRPGKLARHVEVMRRHPTVGLSYSAQHYVDDTGRRLGTLRSPVARGDYVVPGLIELRALAVQNYINFCNAVVRRSVLDRVGFYPAEWQITAEWAMWTRIAKHDDVAYIDEPLVCYRMHAGQLTLQRDPARYLDQLLAVHHEVFDDPTIPDDLRARRRLARANVHLNIALVHWLRQERGDALREARTTLRLLRPWELRDFLRSSALVARTRPRLRLDRHAQVAT